jgi:hypothetical protein
MSMYTQLLEAAVGRRAREVTHAGERGALEEVLRCRAQLDEDEGIPTPTDPDAVPAVLAREIGYDVALLELAEVVGIETDASRFEQPLQERARLERALRDSGITLQTATDGGGRASGAA